jgi:uncharacterized protein (TIGR02145 family)
VYGSNYPPVGEYISVDKKIEFTGTPMYELLLAKPGSPDQTAKVKSGDTFLLPCDYTLTSFTDATGAPGIMNCIALASFTVLPAPPQCPGTVTLSASSPGAIIEWYADAAATATLHTGATYTTPEILTSTTYYVQARIEHTSCLSERVPVLAEVITDTEACCSAPGSTVSFATFIPCPDATVGATWTLRDTREPNNVQMYKVKKMTDGNIWMVQDLKFGDKCDKETFKGSSGSDQTGNVTTLENMTYYGDCRNSPTQGAGYLYDWAAAMNQSGAYLGGRTDIGCSGTGTAANVCQGICPDGWHIPTGDNNGELRQLMNSPNFCANKNDCWLQDSAWEGIPGGTYAMRNPGFWGTGWHFMKTSTSCNAHDAYHWIVGRGGSVQYPFCQGEPYREDAAQVRCIRNY